MHFLRADSGFTLTYHSGPNVPRRYRFWSFWMCAHVAYICLLPIMPALDSAMVTYGGQAVFVWIGNMMADGAFHVDLIHLYARVYVSALSLAEWCSIAYERGYRLSLWFAAYPLGVWSVVYAIRTMPGCSLLTCYDERALHHPSASIPHLHLYEQDMATFPCAL